MGKILYLCRCLAMLDKSILFLFRVACTRANHLHAHAPHAENPPWKTGSFFKTMKSRPEPLCLSYFQYLCQQLRFENELGISFLMSFVSLDRKHRKNISMLAPTLFSWWKFWKIYQTRIWRNPDYWWIDWQWTLFDSQTKRLKFTLRKDENSHKGYSIHSVDLRKRIPDY